MDTKQPEVLRLAYTLDLLAMDMEIPRMAAAELRRQHAEIETLRAGYDAARLEIASLHTQMEAVGAGGMEPLRKRCLHQISEPANAGWCDGCSPDNCGGCASSAAPAQAGEYPELPKGVYSFTKKPVTIQAIRWTGKNLRQVITFTDGPPDTRTTHAGMAWDAYVDLVERDGLKIFTLEGKMLANPGDWIIRGVKGEYYPCKPDVFEATYSPAGVLADLVNESERLFPATDRAAREVVQAAECGNCFEGETDRGHACRKCGGTGVVQPAVQALDVQVLMRVIQRLNQNPYSLTKSECVSEIEAMRDAASAAQGGTNG